MTDQNGSDDRKRRDTRPATHGTKGIYKGKPSKIAKRTPATYDGYSTSVFKKISSGHMAFKTEAMRQEFFKAVQTPLRYPMAEKIIKKFGSIRLLRSCLEAVVGKDAPSLSTIYRWLYPREKGGTDGQIPTRNIPHIMQAARYAGVMLEPQDFYPQRTELRANYGDDTDEP